MTPYIVLEDATLTLEIRNYSLLRDAVMFSCLYIFLCYIVNSIYHDTLTTKNATDSNENWHLMTPYMVLEDATLTLEIRNFFKIII